MHFTGQRSLSGQCLGKFSVASQHAVLNTEALYHNNHYLPFPVVSLTVHDIQLYNPYYSLL
jgi:hypothetical protein